jgi:Ca2+:H+ antiporter
MQYERKQLLKSVKLTKSSAVYFLLIFAPIAVALEFMHVDPIAMFVVAAIALIPLAKLIGDSTEHLATHYGATTGSLLNVTFGNAAEIIIAIVAINAGLIDLVKASITGAIIGNILLILGLSVVAGGFRFKEQRFSKENIGIQSSMLLIAIIGLAVPTILVATVLPGEGNEGAVQILSDSLAIILIIVYILGIVFTFFTHKHLFVHAEEPATAAGGAQTEIHGASHHHAGHWSKKKSFILLAASMAGVIVVSEALGQPFTLVFTLLELAVLFLAAIILNLIVHDGRTNWFEGMMLTAVYIIIAIAFFFAG